MPSTKRMNRYHQWVCNSGLWARAVERDLLPWVLEDLELGPETLEIGPGYGATTRVLAKRLPGRLTVVEVDPDSARKLRRAYGTYGEFGEYKDRVEVLHGDGTDMPLPDRSFDSVVCFTMLHHVPSPEQQDRLFAEAFRVLRPGGVFAGCDGRAGRAFRLIHLGDTYVPVPPQTLPQRLRAAGFGATDISLTPDNFRFRTQRP